MGIEDFSKHPITEEQVKCPVCQSTQCIESLRQNAYIVANSEPDTHPTEYTWPDPRYNNIRPSHYFLWTCNACYYTDRVPNFKFQARNNDDLEHYRDVAKEKFESKDRVTHELGEFIANEPISHERAIAQHLLMVYLLETVKESQVIYHELGRIYLRLGWLFREEKPADLASIDTQIFDFFNQKFDVIGERIESFSNFFTALSSEIDTEFSERPQLHKDKNIMGLKIAYSTYKRDAVHLLLALKNRTMELMEKHQKTLENVYSTKSSGNSFSGILQLIRLDWKNLPDSEEKAIVNSSNFFRQAIKTGLNRDSIKQLLHLYQIIAYGYYRIKHYKILFNYCAFVFESITKKRGECNRIIESAKKKMHQIEKKIYDAKNSNVKIFQDEIDKDLDAKEHIRLRAVQAKKDLSTLQEYSDNFAIIRKKAYNRYYEQEFERMMSILKSHPLMSKNEYLTLLQKEHIPESIVEKYFDMDMIKELKNIQALKGS